MAEADRFIDQMEKLLPQLKDSLEKKMRRVCRRKKIDAPFDTRAGRG